MWVFKRATLKYKEALVILERRSAEFHEASQWAAARQLEHTAPGAGSQTTLWEKTWREFAAQEEDAIEIERKFLEPFILSLEEAEQRVRELKIPVEMVLFGAYARVLPFYGVDNSELWTTFQE